MQVANLDIFIDWLKEETLPGVWSKGVQLSRAVNSIEFLSNDKDEWKFKIKTQERLLAFSVTLWIKEEDSHCNCGSKIEPCHHIVGVAIAMQNGIVKLERSESQTRLEYQWKIDESQGKIELLRWIASDSGRSALTQSLISYISGVQSGRLPGKLPSTTSLDLKIDEILNRSTSSSAGSWRELLACLSELPPISGFSSIKGYFRPLLKITDAPSKEEGVILMADTAAPPDAVFKNGMERVGANLRLTPAKPPFMVPKTVTPSQYERFLSESLPLLHEYFEILNESHFLPRLVDRDPVIEFKIVSMPDDKIALTPFISYGKVAEDELAIKDRAQEQDDRAQANENPPRGRLLDPRHAVQQVEQHAGNKGRNRHDAGVDAEREIAAVPDQQRLQQEADKDCERRAPADQHAHQTCQQKMNRSRPDADVNRRGDEERRGQDGDARNLFLADAPRRQPDQPRREHEPAHQPGPGQDAVTDMNREEHYFFSST